MWSRYNQPPANVEAFKENKEGEKPKTIREIMEAVWQKYSICLSTWDFGFLAACPAFPGYIADTSGRGHVTSRYMRSWN